MSRWNYYESNRNENDRGHTLCSRAKFAGRKERVAVRTAVDYRRFIARKSSASSPLLFVGSRKRSKSEGRSPRSIYQNASGCAASSLSKRSLRVHIRPRNSQLVLILEDSISRSILHTSLGLSFSLYDAAPTKGYLGVCCIFAWGYGSTRICSHTRVPAAIPLIL